MSIKTYSELISLPTFEERFDYLKLDGVIGEETFGFDRYLNQKFYHSPEWRRIRDEVILRDGGCDLACHDRSIIDRIYIHHLNPIMVKDILSFNEYLTNLNYLVCASFETHIAIHYGNTNNLAKLPKERSANDMCPWKR